MGVRARRHPCREHHPVEASHRNGTRDAALPPPTPLHNPVEGKGTATARGPRGKGARHPPAAPPAVPLPDGDGTPHTRGGGEQGGWVQSMRLATRTRGGELSSETFTVFLTYCECGLGDPDGWMRPPYPA